MAEPRTLALKEEIVGRHPAGRHGDRTSSGRNGRKLLSEDITEEEKGTDTKPRGRGVLDAVGTTAAIVFFACGVGSVNVACTEVCDQKNTDAGCEACDTDTSVDTDTDTDTETGEEGPVCDTYDGEDHEAVLEEGEKELLGPVGHWMKIVSLGFSNQIAEAVFMNEGWEKVDFEGNVVEEGDLAAYFIFSADNPTLTVSMGGREQEITLCGVYDLGDGTLVAQFITDNEEGFMHCAYVDSGSLAGPVEYAFSETVTQKVSVQTHNHGFIPDVETGEDQECPGTVSDFKFERTEFEPSLSPTLATVPGEAPNPLEMRGTTQNFIDVGQDAEGKYLRFASTSANGVLEQPLDASLSCGGLTATWAGNAWNLMPLFSYEYAGADYIAEEIISSEERKVYVWIGSTIKEFVLRHPEPIPFGTEEQQGLGLSMFTKVQELREGGQVTIGNKTYDVTLNTESSRISGFVLRPPEETE